MKNRVVTFLGLCSSALLFASSASGQQRTFVSGGGSDANPCTRAAPCRTFGQAISLTSTGGEVVVVDSAGYGPFTVSRSVSIIAPDGVYAGISVFSGDGIDITASASDTVILRGLTVNNQGSNGEGIVHRSGGTLHVESCIVNGFSSGAGLDFIGPGQLEVKDCIMRGNGDGIDVAPSLSSSQAAAIDHVRLEGNAFVGLMVFDGSKVTVRSTIASDNGAGFGGVSKGSAPVQMSLERCVASNNTSSGIIADSAPGAPVDVNVERCVVSNNDSGILSVSSRGSSDFATVRVSNSTVTGNNTGLENDGAPALILSRGNNTVAANKVNTSGTIGSYTPF